MLKRLDFDSPLLNEVLGEDLPLDEDSLNALLKDTRAQWSMVKLLISQDAGEAVKWLLGSKFND
jgi:hypothetical protein